jgi:hypothetical protein
MQRPLYVCRELAVSYVRNCSHLLQEPQSPHEMRALLAQTEATYYANGGREAALSEVAAQLSAHSPSAAALQMAVQHLRSAVVAQQVRVAC